MRKEGQLIWRTDGQDRQAGGQADRWTEGLRSLKTDGQTDALDSVPCIDTPKDGQVDRCKLEAYKNRGRRTEMTDIRTNGYPWERAK